jgi:hypothetical protein
VEGAQEGFCKKADGTLRRSIAEIVVRMPGNTVSLPPHRLSPALDFLQQISTDAAGRKSLDKIGETTADAPNEVIGQTQE